MEGVLGKQGSMKCAILECPVPSQGNSGGTRTGRSARNAGMAEAARMRAAGNLTHGRLCALGGKPDATSARVWLPLGTLDFQSGHWGFRVSWAPFRRT